MTPSLASIARYFRIGVELGLCDPDEAREWAISVIDQSDAPPGEIIEVSWRKPRAQLIADLGAIEGEPEMDLVRGWLLGRLALTLGDTDDGLGRAVKQAMQIARATGHADLYAGFDVIDDELQLAQSGTYGSVAACRDDFDAALRAYGVPPLSARG